MKIYVVWDSDSFMPYAFKDAERAREKVVSLVHQRIVEKQLQIDVDDEELFFDFDSWLMSEPWAVFFMSDFSEDEYDVSYQEVELED